MSDARPADVVLTRGVGAVDHISAVIGRREADRCLAIHVVAGEAERVVADLLRVPSPDQRTSKLTCDGATAVLAEATAIKKLW